MTLSHHTVAFPIKKTSLSGTPFCEAVCGHHQQKNLEDTLRTVLQEELKHISVPQTADHEENTENVCDADILDFLQQLQNE